MKKLFAIFFLSLYLISTTELSQLLKFPVLIEHYFEHKEKNSKLSVVEFLVIHYNNHLENHPHDDDFEQDKRLPFISHGTALNCVFVCPQPFLFDADFNIDPVHRSGITFFKSGSFTNQYLSSIWQPPKFC